MSDLFHGVMGTCFVALCTALVSFSLDVIGPKAGFPKWLKRNAVFSVFTVILCALAIGLCYWVSILLETLQRQSSSTPYRVVVQYSEGFYMIVAAALLSICAVASSLYRLSKEMRDEDDRARLLEDMVNSLDMDPDSLGQQSRTASDLSLIRNEAPPGSSGPPPPLDMILNVPPPPPYAP